MNTREQPDTRQDTALKDEELNDVNAGMKIVVTSPSKFFEPLLRLIFKIKKRKEE